MSAKRIKNDPPEERTLADCLREMLKSETSADVSIEVGPPDGETVTFRAHKCVLRSRIEVFDGMFSSGMAECRTGPQTSEAKVRVEDIDPDVFKQVLDYIYGDSVTSITPESAGALLYAAKKYMLPQLVRECCTCLLDNLDISNVIQFLDHSLILDEPPIEKACLRLISVKANDVLTGTEIVSASRLVMGAILGADSIVISEKIIYETAIRWAEQQFLQNAKQGELPTDLQIREMLGDLLYKIRFPVMKLAEFTEMSEDSDVLSAEEKVSIYTFLVTGKVGRQMKFPTERRVGNEVFIDRVESCTTHKWRSTKHVDALNFKTDHDILLTGIGLFPAYSERGYEADVEILLQSSSSLLKKRVRVPFAEDSEPQKIPFDEPLDVLAGVIYTVKVLSYDTIGCYGDICQAVCSVDDVTFTFTSHPLSQYTKKTYGQIPLFYFCVV